MKPKPILFSSPMVKALLDWRKTQTRRILKPQPFIDASGNFCSPRQQQDGHDCWGQGTDSKPYLRDYIKRRVRFAVGDLLWVRESWAPIPDALSECTGPDDLYFAASVDEAMWATTTWRPSIHLPRWASRLTLEVTEVRVQRLQGISRDDVLAEGITERDGAPLADVHCGWHEPYAALWERINGKGSWHANPWIVAVTFKVHKANVDEILKQWPKGKAA
jgi:hypothetical protein